MTCIKLYLKNIRNYRQGSPFLMNILVFLMVILRDYLIIYSDPATLLEKASLTNICFGILELFFWKVSTDTPVVLTIW